MESKNTFKKSDANGKQLAEEIGKGIDNIHTQKVLEARKNNGVMSFKLPEQLKEDFFNDCENPSELLRAFVRGYVSQRKLMR